MNIIITGGAGFLGKNLAKGLLQNPNLKQLLLVDVTDASKTLLDDLNDKRVQYLCLDLAQEGSFEKMMSALSERSLHRELDCIYHLAAVVSGQAEAEFELGMRVNFDITRNLLEGCRLIYQNMNKENKKPIKFIFSSSLAVFGGKLLPKQINAMTATTPSSSYGTQKAMCELLINDYSRKGFIDGLVLRLPTISVRPGKPNQAASSFVSGIIREPLKGEKAICPVNTDLQVWISSPDTVIKNFIHALTLKTDGLTYRTINLPGITVSIEQMIVALKSKTNQSIIDLIEHTPNEAIEKIVVSWPCDFDITSSLEQGFSQDKDIQSIIMQYMQMN
ncbi:UDP-glucose 4-epimerase [Gammaproteobacteria bacterium]|nr:UDP-glucose 4-epimerase [Gammaproteobacteria bacterium]